MGIDDIKKIDKDTLAEPQSDKIHKKKQLLIDKAEYENVIEHAQKKLAWTDELLAKLKGNET